jgi:4-hydroxybutyryl-CoA dehydratase/vinylacetyl-CoA-Delta-isomerase
MAIRTKQEYIEGLRKQKPKVYMAGEEIENVVDHPAFQIGIRSAGATYELGEEPDYQNLTRVLSPVINEDVSRWTHIMQNEQDAINKVKLMKGIGEHLCLCCYRCLTADTLHAAWAMTYDVDKKYNTNYHQNAVAFTREVQKNDWIIGSCAVDPKGDRSKGPGEQADPDLHIHVVEKRKDGIVVRGAKCHATGSPYTNVVMGIGSTPKGEEAKDYAVIFFAPVDTEGLVFISRPPRKSYEAREFDNPFSNRYGNHVETLAVFDNVFVPWEHVFLCGEYEFIGKFHRMLRASHTWHKCMCRWASLDLSIGATALIADYNGVGNAPHIWDNMCELVISAEIVYSLALAAAVEGWKHESGVYFPKALPVSAGKVYSAQKLGQERFFMQDAAGGLVATMASEEDYRNPITGKYMEKYYKGREGVPTENRMRAMKLIEDLTASEFAGWYHAMAISGGGPPLHHKKTVMDNYDLEKSKRKAMFAAGIKQ